MGLASHLKTLSVNLPNTTGWRAFGLNIDANDVTLAVKAAEIPLVGWYCDDDGEVLPLLAKHEANDCPVIVLSNYNYQQGDEQYVLVFSVSGAFEKVNWWEGTTITFRQLKEDMSTLLWGFRAAEINEARLSQEKVN